MKILSSPWTKAILVAIGLLVVLMAYRPDDSRSQKRIALQANVGAEQAIKLRSTQELLAASTTNGYPATDYSGFQSGVDANEPTPGSASAAELALPQTEFAEVELPLAVSQSEMHEEPELDLMSVATSEASSEVPFEEATIETEYSVVEEAKPVSYAAAVTATPMPTTAPALNDAAALKAVHHIEYGKSLARRNASEAAGQEFLGALRVLAEANDEATNGNAYISSLRSGLLAIKEAGDFKTDDPNNQISMNIATVIEGHETKIISRDEAQTMGASAAMRRYFEFAGRQLGRCGGQNPVAAEALFCMGKMKTISAQWNPDPESAALYEAITFHHASLTADRTNHRSANELGVLLARNGHLNAAEIYLKNSLQISPTPQSWANLAKVHQRKGSAQDMQLADLAMQEYQIAMVQPVVITNQAPIQLVEPHEFIARSPAQHPGERQTVQVPSEVVPVVNEQPVGENPSLVQRIGSLLTPGKVRR